MTFVKKYTPFEKPQALSDSQRNILDQILLDAPFTLLDDIINAFSPIVNKDFKSMFNKNYPKVDSWDDGQKLYIEATVPGLTKNDIEIKVKPFDEDPAYSMLILSYKKESTNEFENRKYSCKEIHRSSFSRPFVISDEMYDIESVKTSLKDGILSIIIDKRVIEKDKVKSEWKNIEIQ